MGSPRRSLNPSPTPSRQSISSSSPSLKGFARRRNSTSSFSSMCSDKHKGIQHNAVNIDNVVTWVSFLLPDCKDHSDSIILFIPGNPGAIEFYDKFLENLFEQCNIPVIGISHAGDYKLELYLLPKAVDKIYRPVLASS